MKKYRVWSRGGAWYIDYPVGSGVMTCWPALDSAASCCRLLERWQRHLDRKAEMERARAAS